MARILHIEDDPANRLLVRKILGPAGFEVIDAADGVEGIRKAITEHPDLVLVDIAIPGLDGYEVTLRLRAEPHLRHVPIVAITAEGNRETSLAVGCDGFLQKPIDARTFVDTIRSYLLGLKDKGDQTSKHLRLQSQRIVSHLEEKVDQLSSANARLVEMDQARKEFYRNVSHELATPMTPIVGYVRLLLDGELGDLNVAQSKAIAAINDCAVRLRGLIDNLLDVTALETGRMNFKYEEYDLARVVQQALGRSEPRFLEKKQRLVHEIHGQMPGIGDAVRLGRALDQLLDNAQKFTPVGGSVGIRARPLADRQFELCVADTGPGVPEHAAKRVFEPFFQADGSETRSYGGAGVGLAVVRGVARGHGGYVVTKTPADETMGDIAFGGAGFTLVISQRAHLSA
ncbi:MAG: hybrid sensor histidine kinase/response regulator [Deltaproteobacteria bacterium]